MADHSFRKLSSKILGNPKKDIGGEDKFSSQIGFLIQNLEIVLTRPEDEIMRQDDDSNDMYFLAKGDAFVVMKERTGKEHQLGRLEPGSHFGEIAMIY